MSMKPPGKRRQTTENEDHPVTASVGGTLLPTVVPSTFSMEFIREIPASVSVFRLYSSSGNSLQMFYILPQFIILVRKLEKSL